MDSATVDQAEAMFKNIPTLQQTLDKSGNEDVDTVITDNKTYHVNEKLEEWIKAVCVAKDKIKKQAWAELGQAQPKLGLEDGISS